MNFLLVTPLFYNNFLQNRREKCRIWFPLKAQFPIENPPDFGFIQLTVGRPLFLLPDGGKLAFTLPAPDVQGVVSLFELGCIHAPV